METIRELDPEGVNRRKKRRLRRRIYDVPGPDFMWHLDGYDKLKPFGFSIHGCIDGYSRRLLWLEVASTNKKPEVIAHYYLKTIEQLKGVPSRIRSDDGSEISMIQPMQITLRSSHQDEFSGEASFIIGTSPANQKIESFWSQLNKERPLWWRHFFAELSSYGFIDNSNVLVIECLRYCFMHIFRKELTDVAVRWNQHLLAPSKQSILPHGRPDTLYQLPELSNSQSFRQNMDMEWFREFDNPSLAFSCSDNDPCFVEFADIVLGMEGYNIKPDEVSNALKTYFTLLEAIQCYG